MRRNRQWHLQGARFLLFVLLLTPTNPASLASAQNLQKQQPVVRRSAPIFIFYEDEFWLNLHHFLYVLGRAENKTRDSAREAVNTAPADQQQGLALLTPKEQAAWKGLVSEYAAGVSKKDIVFDEGLSATTSALARVRNTKSIHAPEIDPALVALLTRAAPIYKKAWWPRHRAANNAWRVEIESLVKRYGMSVLTFISNAYHMEWPAQGYGVHLSAYCNWAGAYSVTGNLLVVASLSPANHGPSGLESIFHEGMHQWDDLVAVVLTEQAGKLHRPVPEKLSHALIFFTAGEAVRHVIPDYVRYADRSGVWQRGMLRERDALTEIWKPYLDGHGTRDKALAELIKRLND